MHRLVVFTGGGTGGHVFPGLAVADVLRESGRVRVIWIGSSRGMERRLVEGRGIRFHGIPSGKLRRYLSVHNVIDIGKVAAGFVVAAVLLARLKPAFAFSKGGYVSVPVVAAARLLGIRCATHESDSDPGLATRINARLADTVLLSYASSATYFPEKIRPRCRVTGNPVRRDLAAANAERGRRILGFSAERPVVFFVGGSLGSAQINGLVAAALWELLGVADIVHQRGEHPAPRPDGGGYASFAFIREEYPHVLAAADLVVCRAGAGTLWELAMLHKPAVLIPLPRSSSRGDQQRNARLFAEKGAAVVLDGEEATPERLCGEVRRLLSDGRELERMAHAAAGFDAAGAADRIASVIMDEVEWTS